MLLRPALPLGRFDNTGAGLEPKKKYGKPFRRDPAPTKARFQTTISKKRMAYFGGSFLMTRAGVPKAMLSGGMGVFTRLLAPMTE